MDALDSFDFLSLFLLAVVLASLGREVTRKRLQIHTWAVRCGVATFLLILIGVLIERGLDSPDVLLGSLFRAGFAGGIVTGGLDLLLTVTAGAASVFLIRPLRAIGSSIQRVVSWARRAGRERQQQQRQRRQGQLLQPLRETETAERREQDRVRQAEAHVREQLRFDVRLFYDRYRSELQSVFPQDTFDSYFASFLTDSTPLQLFEQRAEQLKDMIRDRLQLGVKELRRFESVEEVVQYYAEQKRQLTALAADDPELVDTLRGVLEDAQDDALQEFLK